MKHNLTPTEVTFLSAVAYNKPYTNYEYKLEIESLSAKELIHRNTNDHVPIEVRKFALTDLGLQALVLHTLEAVRNTCEEMEKLGVWTVVEAFNGYTSVSVYTKVQAHGKDNAVCVMKYGFAHGDHKPQL